MQITERTGSSDDYRYGFNGKEKDDEIKGGGNSYDFGARMYDPRVGKFLAIDPFEKNLAWSSPYSSFANSPLLYIDSDGKLFVIPPTLSKSEKIKVQFMLDVLKLVKPEIYNYLNNSPIKINVSVGIVDQTGVPAGTILNGFTQFPNQRANLISDGDGKWETRDFKMSLSKAITVDDKKYDEAYMNSADPSEEYVSISEDVANQIARLKGTDGDINIMVENKDDAFFLSSIGGHEFGHAYFGLLNPAYHYILQDLLPGKGGHTNNLRYGELHPNGKFAFDLQNQVGNDILKEQIDQYEALKSAYEKDLKKAKKEEKDESKTKP